MTASEARWKIGLLRCWKGGRTIARVVARARTVSACSDAERLGGQAADSKVSGRDLIGMALGAEQQMANFVRHHVAELAVEQGPMPQSDLPDPVAKMYATRPLSPVAPSSALPMTMSSSCSSSRRGHRAVDRIATRGGATTRITVSRSDTRFRRRGRLRLPASPLPGPCARSGSNW